MNTQSPFIGAATTAATVIHRNTAAPQRQRPSVPSRIIIAANSRRATAATRYLGGNRNIFGGGTRVHDRIVYISAWIMNVYLWIRRVSRCISLYDIAPMMRAKRATRVRGARWLADWLVFVKFWLHVACKDMMPLKSVYATSERMLFGCTFRSECLCMDCHVQSVRSAVDTVEHRRLHMRCVFGTTLGAWLHHIDVCVQRKQQAVFTRAKAHNF